MKHLIILFMAGISFGSLSAQQPDEATKRALEREIKGAPYNYQHSDYIYGEAVSNTKDEAVRMAKTSLVMEINKEALNRPEWKSAKPIQAKDIESYTHLLDLMRGNKFRIIAYFKKDNIQVVFGGRTSERIMADNKQETAQSAAQPQTERVQTVPASASTSTSVSKQTPPSTNIDSRKNTGGLLGQIVNAPSLPEIQKILAENKRKGKAAYGTMDKLTAPENAYLIVFKTTGEIVAILDKGSADNRKDLLSGETKGKEIQTQNQVIWFQIF